MQVFGDSYGHGPGSKCRRSNVVQTACSQTREYECNDMGSGLILPYRVRKPRNRSKRFLSHPELPNTPMNGGVNGMHPATRRILSCAQLHNLAQFVLPR